MEGGENIEGKGKGFFLLSSGGGERGLSCRFRAGVVDCRRGEWCDVEGGREKLSP